MLCRPCANALFIRMLDALPTRCVPTFSGLFSLLEIRAICTCVDVDGRCSTLWLALWALLMLWADWRVVFSLSTRVEVRCVKFWLKRR